MLKYFSVAVFQSLKCCFSGDVGEIETQSGNETSNYGTVDGDFVCQNKFSMFRVLINFLKKVLLVKNFKLKNIFKK